MEAEDKFQTILGYIDKTLDTLYKNKQNLNHPKGEKEHMQKS